jgi:GTP-binding protein
VIVDEVKIYLKAGKGGEGASTSMMLSPRRVVGGGGDGGKGGDVILKVSPHLSDLIKFNDKRKFIAGDGEKGREYNKKGKSGKDCVVYVPKGTQVLDLEANLIVDLLEDNTEYLICKGGRPGKGNYKKLYTLSAEEGEEKEVILDYCIPNDLVLLGFPNSGKTALFNKLTGKSYKVAAYPFTTKSCVWAPVEFEFKRFTVLDTPPLKKHLTEKDTQEIFLKHLLRSRIVAFLSDSPSNYQEDFRILKERVSLFNPNLLKKKKIFYLLTKVDTIDRKELTLEGIIPISAEKDMGIEELKSKIVNFLKKM